MNRSNSDPRSVLKTGAALAGATCLPRWFVEESRSQAAQPPSKSPNERLGVLLIGIGLMGGNDARLASAFGDIVAVCDVDRGRAEKGAAQFKAEGVYSDFRKAMEHRGVHVVLNVTPDHWHTLRTQN